MTEQKVEDLKAFLTVMAFQTFQAFQNLAKLSSPMPLDTAKNNLKKFSKPASDFKYFLQFSCYGYLEGKTPLSEAPSDD